MTGSGRRHLACASFFLLVLTTWSITAWLKTSAAGGWQALASKGPDPYNYYLQIRDSGISNSGFTGAGAWQEAWGTANVQDGEWYHIAGTYDMNDLTICVDGNLEKAETYGSEPDITTAPLGIGADSRFPCRQISHGLGPG